jgi:hypothetical protein
MKASELVRLALDGLAQMQLASGLFCREVTPRTGPTGESMRYTLMARIALAKAEAYGHRHEVDLRALDLALADQLDEPLQPGDLGLYLWADAATGEGRTEALLDLLERRLDQVGGLAPLEGQELGWIVCGLALQTAGTDSARVRSRLAESVDALLANQRASGLLAHWSRGGLRPRFPNFATEIYGVLALANVAALELDERAALAASRVADRLLSLQLEDGGWPWIYDTRTGRVVERYELYSVHQHAMAPMALFQLFEATGNERYVGAASRGLEWIFGRNELGRSMVDAQRTLIYRSVRRRRPFDRLLLHMNTGSAAMAGSAIARRGRLVELNDTCRPYELAWIVEAWCGREDLLDR